MSGARFLALAIAFVSGARFLALAIALVTLAAGCVPTLPLDNAGCPCATGYHCCPLENTCLPTDQICPLSRNCPLPPTAANVLTVGATDVNNPTPNILPLDERGTLTLVHGPQGGGGYHIWTQLELLGIEPPITVTRYLFDPADATRTRDTALRYQVDQPSLYCADDKFFLLLDPPRIFVCPSLKKGVAMFDRDLVLRTEIDDAAGGPTRVGEQPIHPLCPPGDTNCSTSTVTGCAAP